MIDSSASRGGAVEHALDYALIDADNHYYEAEDCFTRHGDEAVRRYVTWVSEGRKRHLLFGNIKTNDPRNPTAVLNPTYSKVAKPGAYHEMLRALEGRERAADSMTISTSLGELEPPAAAYRDRDERIRVMDAQGVEKIMIFPTLGLTVEGYMSEEPEILYKVMHAFNLWLDDDWGLNRDGRIHAPPVISMRTVEGAVAELEWALSRGARAITIQPGPAYGRSPADTHFDPFWHRVDDAGILVTYHAPGGPSAYDQAFSVLWGRETSDPAYLETLRRSQIGFEHAIMDTARALILGNLFARFPNITAASIEMGCTWVPYLLHNLDHAGPLLNRQIEAFGTLLKDTPSEVFKEKFWVSPFPEEDVCGLARLIGADHVLMGSDWPHPEGVPTPAAYASCLNGLDDRSARMILRENALGLLGA